MSQCLKQNHFYSLVKITSVFCYMSDVSDAHLFVTTGTKSFLSIKVLAKVSEGIKARIFRPYLSIHSKKKAGPKAIKTWNFATIVTCLNFMLKLSLLLFQRLNCLIMHQIWRSGKWSMVDMVYRWWNQDLRTPCDTLIKNTKKRMMAS